MKQRFGKAPKPRVVATDRGVGFFHPNGKITAEYAAALRQQGLQAIQGDDARNQPGKLADLTLHETAVSWVRSKLLETRPKQAWKESTEEHYRRLRGIAQGINAEFDVEGLCAEFPSRIADLISKGGDKLAK